MISYVIIAIVAVAVSLLISIPVTANISVKKKAADGHVKRHVATAQIAHHVG